MSEGAQRADATQILAAFVHGEASAAGELLDIAYVELRRIAARFLKRERESHTLQPTALVHEAWLKLIDQERTQWQGRAHFLGIAAQAMRRVLIDHARGVRRDKRGGDWRRVTLQTGGGVEEPRELDLIAVDEALDELATLSERQARLVEMRFFGGLENREIGEVLGISERTVERDWRVARAFLSKQLKG